MKLRNRTRLLLAIFIVISAGNNAESQIITTIAGIDSMGYNGDNIPATSAMFSSPGFMCRDKNENIYISDTYNDRIRKINPIGIISTIAGTGLTGYNGDNIPATSAKIARPVGIAIDKNGNIYFSDAFNSRVRKIDTSGIITTIAGTGIAGSSGDNGPATAAKIMTPHGLVLDSIGNIYVADFDSNRIRKISPSGIITTIAGNATGIPEDGIPAIMAEIYQPFGIALDATGEIVFTEHSPDRIRKINSIGIISTIAGVGTSGFSGDGGPATNAKMSAPTGIAFDHLGNLYVSDGGNHRVRKIGTDNIINTIVGTGVAGYSGDGGPAIDAEVHLPLGIMIDSVSNLYVVEFGSNCIRKITSTEKVTEMHSSLSAIAVYPNPCRGECTLDINSDINESATIRIADMLGATVVQGTTPANHRTSLKIPGPPGIYFVSVTNRSATQTMKVEVMR